MGDIPREEDNLRSGPSIISLEFDIHHSITAIIFRQILAEIRPCLGPFPLFLDDNQVVLDLISDVAEVVRGLLELELVERSGHLISGLYSSGLVTIERRQ